MLTVYNNEEGRIVQPVKLQVAKILPRENCAFGEGVQHLGTHPPHPSPTSVRPSGPAQTCSTDLHSPAHPYLALRPLLFVQIPGFKQLSSGFASTLLRLENHLLQPSS